MSLSRQQSHHMDASVQDFIAFHGMFCLPSTARRCVDSFVGGGGGGGGVILFADAQTYKSNDKEQLISGDFSHKRRGRYFGLNVFNYYLLVLCSGTGLSSLLGWTKLTLQQTTSDEPHQVIISPSNSHTTTIASKTHPQLQVTPLCLNYLLEETRIHDRKGNKKEEDDPKLVLKERFEYEFGGILEVMMLHFICVRSGKRHLVEVYEWKSPVIQYIVSKVFAAVHALEVRVRGGGT